MSDLPLSSKSFGLTLTKNKAMTQQNAPAQTNEENIALPSDFSLEAVLSKLYKGSVAVLPDAVCQFKGHWDFSTNEGMAELVSVDGTPVNIPLHPMGISGQLDFMSDMKPTPYTIQGKTVTIFRVILDLKPGLLPPASSAFAAIMFNEDGSCIETTQNFDDQIAEKLQ